MFFKHGEGYVHFGKTKWTKICARRTKTNFKDLVLIAFIHLLTSAPCFEPGPVQYPSPQKNSQIKSLYKSALLFFESSDIYRDPSKVKMSSTIEVKRESEGILSEASANEKYLYSRVL